MDIFNYDVINYEKLLILKSKKIGLTDSEAYILLIMLNLSKMNQLLTPKVIKQYSSLAIHQIDEIMVALINRGYIDRIQGQLSFNPLFQKLRGEEVKKVKQVNLIEYFEQGFGRPLSPQEVEFINSFKREGFDDQTINEALNEAIKANVKNFRYIEKILMNWKQYGRKIARPEVKKSEFSDEVKNYKWWE